ncbi:hypothetical protein D3C76_1190730 [compost metagenome]
MLQRLQAAFDCLAGKAKATDLAFGLERGERGINFAFSEDRQVVAVGVHQHQVDEVSLKALQAAFDRKTGVRGAEVVTGQAVGKLFADLADDHPILTLTTQQRAKALFAAAIGRRGVDQVDSQVARELEQHPRFIVVGDLEAIGVLHPLIAAEFYRAQAQGRYQQAGAAQGTMQVVQSRLAHGSNCSQAGMAIGGLGSGGKAVTGPG